MIVAARLGGFREDAIGILSVVVGQQKATSFMTGLENQIRMEARAGAEQAIPTIKSEVRTEAKAAVTPLVVASLVVSALAVVGSGYAIFRARK